MKIKLCLPFYHNFEAAKSGLREMAECCEKISEWNYVYEELEITVEPRRGNFPKGELSNNLVTDDLTQTRNDYITGDFDKYFFVDADIIWKFQDFVKLCRYDYDIVHGPYIGHAEKGLYQCGEWKRPGISAMRYPISTTGVHLLDWIGMGFTCIKKQVFEGLEYPWFRHQMIKKDGGLQEVGEDIGFCMLANVYFDIMVDFDINLEHKPLPGINWEITKRSQIVSEEKQGEQDRKKLNPDAICQQALNNKMEVYKSKEVFETVLKKSNDSIDTLIQVIHLMKGRILELEKELKALPKLEEPKEHPQNEGGGK